MVKFWIYDVSVLANKNQLLEIWPYQYLSMERKFNAISRLIIYLTILGYFFSRSEFSITNLSNSLSDIIGLSFW